MSDAADEPRAAWVVRLYEAHGPRLFRYATMILADRQDAEDVVQQVFSAVLAGRARPDDAEQYLLSAVRNASFSLLRRRKTARAARHRCAFVVPATTGAHVRARRVLLPNIRARRAPGAAPRFDEEIRLAREPWPQRFESMKALHRLEPRPRQPFSSLTPGLGVPMPPVVTGPNAVRVAETLALNRSAVVALGVERFRRQHNGAPPHTADALVPQYLTLVPTDPFSGTPLRFTADATGYTIYSVGMNQRDDGGAIKTGDVGIRVPLTVTR